MFGAISTENKVGEGERERGREEEWERDHNYRRTKTFKLLSIRLESLNADSM